tara:strand:- start:4478 stop:6250 length:1773 start_codon:yes stop_codon:yes gene_type:complete
MISMRRILKSVFFAVLFFPVIALGCIDVNLAGNAMLSDYQLYLPKAYDANRSRSYPTIYILGLDKLTDIERIDICKTLDEMDKNVLIEPLITVFVSTDKWLKDDSIGLDLYARDLVVTAINYVDKHYNSRSERDGRLLIGGYVAAAYGLTHPDIFKGVITLNFPSLLDENRRKENLLAHSIAKYVEQPERIPIYIVAGDDKPCSDHENKLQQFHRNQVNYNMQAVQLYQKLHRTNIFQQQFNKYDRVPASPAELRIMNGNGVKKAYLNGIEEGLKYFFAYSGKPVQLEYDVSRYQTKQKGIIEKKTSSIRNSSAFTKTEHISLAYKIYLPYGYDDERNIHYPVLYLLHGSGGNEKSWNKFFAILDAMIERRLIPRLIAVAPITGNSYWIDSNKYGAVESSIIQELIPEVDSHYRTISHRSGRGVIGFSMGGYGALRYTLAYPELFSSAVLLSPAIQHGAPPTTSGAVKRGAFGVPFSLKKWKMLNYPLTLKSYLKQKQRTPIYIITGDDEWNHVSEKTDLPKDASRYNMEMQAVTLYQHLIQSTENDLEQCIHNLVELNIIDGGHDIGVWAKGFELGIEYMFDHGFARPR